MPEPAGEASEPPGGMLERLLFGTQETAGIDAAVAAFCRATLGGAPAAVLFRTSSVGAVFGLRLDDGRGVVVKVHQPRERAEALRAVQRVQAHLHREDFPCPAPLAGPAPVGGGLAVAEELLDAGEVRDTHDPGCRRLMAEALARHLELAQACGRPAALGGRWSAYVTGRLWPAEFHAPHLDVARAGEDVAWIDAIAARAKRKAMRPAATVLGHHDWSGKHVRFAAGRITAVYDWDSLALGREAVVVGNAAMSFTANFDLPGLVLAPAPDELRAFVDEYSAARRAPLSREEREQVAACATFLAAYTARCEHRLHPGGERADDPTSFSWALRTHGERYLDP